MPNQWGCFTQKSVTLDGNNRPPMSIGGCERISMTVVEAFDPNEVRLTDNAASKVRALVEDEDAVHVLLVVGAFLDVLSQVIGHARWGSPSFEVFVEVVADDFVGC